MTSPHAMSSPPTAAALLAALAPALALALAACNGTSPPPASEATPAPAAEATPAPTAPTPAPSPTPSPRSAPPPASEPAPPAGTQLARFDGYGDVRFGMDVAAARKAWQGELKGPSRREGCYYLNPVSNPTRPYFAFMIEDGKFVRYDVGNDSELAPGGGRRGMSESQIATLYGARIKTSPHEYSDGKYLRIKDEAGPGVLVFETDGAGRVTEWHVGLPPQADYVEGCS